MTKDAKLHQFEQQVIASRTIQNTKSLDWLFGGLNFQIEHHICPSVPSHRLRAMQKFVKPKIERSSLPYDFPHWQEAITDVHRHFRNIARSSISMKTCFIINSKAASGRALQKWRKIEPTLALKGKRDVIICSEWQSIKHKARTALEQGADQIVAVGGDGTVGQVANAFFEDSENIFPDRSFAVLFPS
ncbi:Fatty acid desaturase [Pseudobacteriovorax antillogorgiicola]|uniref:Fatty acid desaturase n=1 Tax=Pseudobacteriovorax antillogorgiicola TaxID=1513793 RepID=A0A1Y6BZ39_9BACT|nr:fatty acid desaturase [Pseudobacteriovorax antillogorgiicola]SMF25394.1 Fatty acid desaturase [Pseudobacteriovorax antillogorgiicola]